MSGPHVYTVRELTAIIKQRLVTDPRLSQVAVGGEISNFNHYTSGHMYFTLKDRNSRLRCVMFRRDNARLRFRPEDGMAVIARGDVSVYEVSGQYQLYVRDLVPAGHGELALAFEQLKERLAKEGLFDDARKRPLPFLPRAVGVVTSIKGAALRDIISVTVRRYPGMPIYVAPAVVQGADGPASVVAGIERMNNFAGVDVLIVGRGGGSLEDLWTFNDEAVARAIAASRLPVVSAVGHETDFTIADFVADVRAPTPSAAAELVVPEKAALLSQLQSARERMVGSVRRRIEQGHRQLDLLESRPVLARPTDLLRERRQLVDEHIAGAYRLLQQRVETDGRRLAGLAGKLDALSPLSTLARGYGIPRRADTEAIIRTGDDVVPGDDIIVTIADAELWGRVQRVAARRGQPGTTDAANAAGNYTSEGDKHDG